jgi:hypothetical protein
VTVRVEYLDGEPNGLAAMLGGLIEANLAQHPERRRLLRPAAIGIVALDVHTAVTLTTRPDRVTLANGLAGIADVVVRTDSDTLLALSSAPLRFGFPDGATRDGRAIVRKLLRGDLRVRGLFRHPRVVARLNRLLSVS